MILQKAEVVNCDLCLMFIIKKGVLSPNVLCILKSYEPAEVLSPLSVKSGILLTLVLSRF